MSKNRSGVHDNKCVEHDDQKQCRGEVLPWATWEHPNVSHWRCQLGQEIFQERERTRAPRREDD